MHNTLMQIAGILAIVGAVVLYAIGHNDPAGAVLSVGTGLVGFGTNSDAVLPPAAELPAPPAA